MKSLNRSTITNAVEAALRETYEQDLKTANEEKNQVDVILENMDHNYFAHKAAQSSLKSGRITITVDGDKIIISQCGLTESGDGTKQEVKHFLTLNEEQIHAMNLVTSKYFKGKSKDKTNKKNNYYR
jgi:hypothetical protein